MATKLRELASRAAGITLIWRVPSKVDGVPNVMAPVATTAASSDPTRNVGMTVFLHTQAHFTVS
jgi:hypothetical protein